MALHPQPVIDDYLDLTDYVYDFTMYMQSIYFNIEYIIREASKERYGKNVSLALLVLFSKYESFSMVMSRLFVLTLITYI